MAILPRLAPLPAPPRPGVLLARGVARALHRAGLAVVEEVTLPGALRVDLMALDGDGSIWIVECKSCRADFQGDRKWQGYLDYCDRFFWAVDSDFPVDLLPPEDGLILADSYDAELVRPAPLRPMPAARRKATTLRFARHAALRLHIARDPGLGLGLEA